MDISPGLLYLWHRVCKLLFAWDSVFSLSSLICALTVSALFIAWRRYRKGRTIVRAQGLKRHSVSAWEGGNVNADQT